MIKQFFSSVWSAIFGKVTWNTPPWINYFRMKASENPRSFWGKGLVFLIFLVVIGYGTYWYINRPEPNRIIAQITPPKLTPNESELIPDNLTIDFGIIANGLLNNRPVAPIAMIGKEVPKGITLTPAFSGTWVWESDSHLVFTPDEDWPAGQTYTITFAKDTFAPGIKMASLSHSFSTLPFQALISKFSFYQDPTNPQMRQAVATVNFSYPVLAESLEKHISLKWQTIKWSNSPFKYTLSYDKNKRTAYIRSEPITLPDAERYLELTLTKGIEPLAGAPTHETETATLLIPDAGSYFKISRMATSIVRNQQDRPEQLLTIETTIGVTEDTLNKAVHAYVLPTDYPATAAEKAKPNYHWQDPGEVTPAILALSTPLSLQAIPADRDYATLHSYRYNTGTPAYIYVKIDKGIKGFGNFVLTNDFANVLSVPEYPQEITFLHKGSLLALGTEEKLSVLIRGLGAVKFNIARILPNDINHLVTQTGGDFSNPYFTDANFNQNNISEIFSNVQQFDASDPGKAQYTAIDFSKLLSTQTTGQLGLFLLQARGWDIKNEQFLPAQASRLILITDLGLLVKNNFGGTHDVFVQSISHGSPVNNATVSILGKNGLAILTRVTDAEGRANFPDLADFIDEREPTVYLVRQGNDVAFMPFNRFDRQLNYSRFDVGGIYNYHQTFAPLTAYIFSDRGIYRPGDDAHIAMIVKQPYVMPQPAGLPLQVIITDPRGMTVKDEKLVLNETGYLTLDFKTTATSPTGQYLVSLYIVKDNLPSNLIGSLNLTVAEFQPDRMRISSQFSPAETEGWLSPTDLKVKVGLWNLYGAPAVDHKVTGKILLSPHAVTFKSFPDYTFIDPLLNPKAPPKVFTEDLAETTTNDKGEAELDLKLERFEKATYQLTVFTEGFETEGGRSVNSQTTALISPLPYFVGYKSDGDLRYIKEGDVRNIHFIAINPELKQQALSSLKLELSRLRPVTTLVKREDGTYQYQSIIQTSQISSTPFTIDSKGSDYPLSTKEIGDYQITLVDASGTELSRFNYSVVGTSQQPIPRNAELNVKLNKAVFNAGEEIEMQITAPYTGSGLITIERDKVYASQWFKTDSTSSIQKIKIPADFQGNGYVNIAFVRDLNSPEIYMSPLSYTVLPFSVTHQARTIQVNLTAPPRARPGEPLTMTYQTDKPGKIIVFAVDEGILQVSNYKTPDPLAFFFQKYALDVTTFQIVDQILPKFIAERELSAVGGDGGEAALRQHLNPFKRKTDVPVVFWSGMLDADSTPQQLIYQVPDYFNGTLRIMAVAVANDAVGSASTTSEIRGDFVINPNVPTFVAPGDEFEVTAGIANNVEKSGKEASLNVQLLASPQLEIVGQPTEKITVAEGREGSVRFKVRAKAVLGSAELKWIVKLNDKVTAMVATLSVRPASAYSTSVTSGYANTASKTLPLDRTLYSAYRHVNAAVSPSPLILIAGLQRYLNEYPYGCVEQLVSKAFPLLAMNNQPWFEEDAKTIADKIQVTIQLLSQRQLASGGFNYWPNGGAPESNDFASVYAMHFLTDAKAAGYNVSSDMFSAGIGFLKDIATREMKDLAEARLIAYAIYILTRNEIVTTNYLTHLQIALNKNTDMNWRQDITSAYIAATYQLLKNTADADKIITYYKPQLKKANSTNDFYNQSIGDAEYLYLVARHFPSRLPNIDNQYVISLVDALNNESISTILSSYTSLALAAYGQFYPTANDAVLSIKETLNDGSIRTLAATNGLYQNVSIDEAVRDISFINPKKQAYFYQLTQSGFDNTLPTSAIRNGIEVFREFRTLDNKVVTSTKLGDELIVHIRARATDNNYHENIALVDLLPGGFEVVIDSVKVQNMDYVDVREDRVIFFGSLSSESKELSYRIKATNIGKFVVPPMFGTAMYNPSIRSVSLASQITVE